MSDPASLKEIGLIFNSETILKLFHEDAIFHLGGGYAITRRDLIQNFIDWFHGAFERILHTIKTIRLTEDGIIIESGNLFTFHNGEIHELDLTITFSKTRGKLGATGFAITQGNTNELFTRIKALHGNPPGF